MFFNSFKIISFYSVDMLIYTVYTHITKKRFLCYIFYLMYSNIQYNIRSIHKINKGKYNTMHTAYHKK